MSDELEKLRHHLLRMATEMEAGLPGTKALNVLDAKVCRDAAALLGEKREMEGRIEELESLAENNKAYAAQCDQDIANLLDERDKLRSQLEIQAGLLRSPSRALAAPGKAPGTGDEKEF